MVIQRLQNLYFLIVSALMGLFCFCPFMKVTTTDGVFIAHSTAGAKLYDGEVVNMIYNWPTLIVTVLAAVLAVVAIFRYGNLKLQRTIAKVDIFMVLISLALIIPNMIKDYATTSFTFALALPVVAIAFLWLAIKGINHDIKVLSSADRIR